VETRLPLHLPVASSSIPLPPPSPPPSLLLERLFAITPRLLPLLACVLRFCPLGFACFVAHLSRNSPITWHLYILYETRPPFLDLNPDHHYRPHSKSFLHRAESRLYCPIACRVPH
jgi:hypothetical protein